MLYAWCTRFVNYRKLKSDDQHLIVEAHSGFMHSLAPTCKASEHVKRENIKYVKPHSCKASEHVKPHFIFISSSAWCERVKHVNQACKA